MCEVLFEDNHLLVLKKPSGLLTQPSGTEQQSAEEWGKAWIKAKYKKPGAVFLHAVHRLDKPVSGIVLFAKTSKALSRLNASMRIKEVRKVYSAEVEGCPEPSEGRLEHYLFHEEHQARIVSKETPGATRALLGYRVLERCEHTTVLEVILETGRYHQIRAQFSAIGCPIVGDRKYGSRSTFEGGAIHLHHGLLQIPHPVGGELLEFRCEASLT